MNYKSTNKPENTKKIVTLVPVVTVSLVEVEQECVLHRWKADEVPIGAWFKSDYNDGWQRIIGYSREFGAAKFPAILLEGGKYDWLNHYFIGDLITSISEPKYSWDGIEWHRCGTWKPV